MSGWMTCRVFSDGDLISIQIDDLNSLSIRCADREEDEAKFELRGPIPNPDQVVPPDRYRELLEARIDGLEAMLTGFVRQTQNTHSIDAKLWYRARDYLAGSGPT